MTWIHCVAEKDATGELKALYDAWFAANPERPSFPGILKCFSLRPEMLKAVMDASYSVHFADGYLTRRIKEMIATLVSGLNRCPY